MVHQPTAQIFHDKRLTNYATMHVGDAEHYYAAEAALMLAWKYSRPDLAEKWALEMEDSTMELQRKAAAEFRKRAAEGRLPAPLDPEGSWPSSWVPISPPTGSPTPMPERYEFALTEDSVYQYVMALVREFAGEGGVVADVGCGYGAIAEAVRDLGMTYVGLDVDPKGLNDLSGRGFETRSSISGPRKRRSWPSRSVWPTARWPRS